MRTWDCKIDGCEDTAYKGSGPYAMLCRFHTEEARRARNGSAATPVATSQPAPAGSFEFRAHALLELGRQVDEAFAAYQPARARLEEAVRRWHEAVAALPANGELDAAAANRLLTGALARADTDRHEPRAERAENPASAALDATARHRPSLAS